MEEVWKDIPGYEGIYQASNLGRINSLHFGRCKILKQVADSSNYKMVFLWKNKKRKIELVHRLILKSFKGNSELQCNHINGIKHDNRIENLEWVTRSENAIHAYKIGIHESVRGERNGISKLTEKDVRLIKRMNGKRSIKTMAKLYHVSYQTIWGILNNKSWSHVDA